MNVRALFLGEEEDYSFIKALVFSILIFMLFALLSPSKVGHALNNFIHTLIKLLPAFLLVFFLMLLVELFFDPKELASFFKGIRGWRLWLFALVSGIISTGPIYMWYPLLAKLKKEAELSEGYIATFLYARAVKLPLLPFLILYFGWLYALALTLAIILLSLLEGAIMDYIMRWNDESSNSI